MDFMGIGTWELMVIGLIALIVLGPKQMIIMARKAGELLRQLQEVWQEASKTIDKEIKAIEEEAGDLTTLPKEITALTTEMKNALTLDLSPLNGRTPSTTSQDTPQIAPPQPTPSIRPPDTTMATPPAPSAWTGAPAGSPASTPPADSTAGSTAPTQPPVESQPAGDGTTKPDALASTQPAETQSSEAPSKYSAWSSKKR